MTVSLQAIVVGPGQRPCRMVLRDGVEASEALALSAQFLEAFEDVLLIEFVEDRAAR